MKKIVALLLLTISFLTAYCQRVSLSGDTAIFNEEGIVLRASFTPNTSGTWYWASTDPGLNLASQYGSILSVTPSDTGVFLFRAVFFNGVRAFVQDFKVTVAPCGAKLTLKDYENQTYRSKRYGSVCWMAQNLRSTLYSPDGTAIPFAHTYNDNESFAEDYGRLYTYSSALRDGTGSSIQGACPDGWQIPMESHLNAVINQNSYAYDYQSGGWLSNSATNLEGFYLYPAGFYNASTSRYENMYGESYLILNTPVITNNQVRVGGCSHNCPSWLINDVSVNNAYSVRCIKTHPLIDTTRPAPRKLYTIQYIRNGAESGSMDPQTYVDNSNITLAANTFAHSGNWQFTGWNTKADGTGTSFTNQQAFTLTQDTVLYAQWHTFCTSTPRSNETGLSRIDTVKDHEGNAYTVVQIGNQCWMKENMRATTSPSTGISILQYPAQNTSYTGKRAYYPNDSVSLVARMGVFYNWNAAVDTFNTTYGETSGNTDSGNAVSVNFLNNHRGICPEGWHVPTHNEWQILVDAVDNKAGKLAGGNDWTLHISEMGTPGNYDYTYRNQSGFLAVPASGYTGCYGYLGSCAFFWSATQGVSYGAYARGLGYNSADVFSSTNDNGKFAGYSVRCVRDTIDTLTFKSNNGTGLSTTQYVKRGTPTTLNANTFTHDGNWEFIGWSTSSCDNTVTYADQDSITTHGNDTLYAQWHTFCTGTARFTETGSGRIDTVKDHEGNDYTVVQIGNQCWLKENMRCTTSPKGNLNIGADTTSLYKAYYYDNTSATQFSLRERGYYYNWAGALDTNGTSNINANFTNRRGICPQGWHIPAEAEWQALEVNTGICDSSTATNDYWRGSNAGRLTGGDNWSNSTLATAPGNYSYSERNNSGFSALPAGYFTGSSFSNAGIHVYFWSATSISGNSAYYRDLQHSKEEVYRRPSYKYNGFSVRCVRDDVIESDTLTFMPNGATGGSMEKQVVTRGVATAIQANTFTHDGNWEFIGWNDACDGNGTHYANQANITTSGNVTLYAQWHTFCTGTHMSNELGTARIDSVKDHQDNWYKVVQIGNQCWTKENMRCTSTIKGDLTLGGANKSKSVAYYYDNTSDSLLSLRERGYLYNWPAALDTSTSSPIDASFSNRRGICPDGWHIPTDDEWDTLALHAGCSSASNVGTGLGRLTGGDTWDVSSNATAPGNYSYSERNASGFTALPAGNSNGSEFNRVGERANFWSATSFDDDNAYRRNLLFSDEYVYSDPTGHIKRKGFSVRCVRNDVDTISFVTNGGTGTMPQQLVVRGTSTTLNSNTFTHIGNWQFVGWKETLNGIGNAYADQAQITTDGNVTLYAQWHTFCTGTPLNNELGTSRIDSVKDHQDNWYKVVQIGNQCWTKENMRCTSSIKGDFTLGESDKSKSVAYYYDNTYDALLSLRERGYLYNWPAALDTSTSSPIDASFSNRRGICPDGWHIPTDAEWDTLALRAGCSSVNNNGTGLGRLTGGDTWDVSSNATAPGNYSYSERNASGFTALPAGNCNGSNFNRVGERANFWSATSFDGDNAYRRNLLFSDENVYRDSSGHVKHKGFSVRCVRDVVIVIDTLTFMPNGATGGSTEKQVVVRGVATAIQANTFTHDGNWEFIGWSTGDCDNTVTYADQANITTNGNDTLYAQWHTFCAGTPLNNELGTARVDSVKDHQNNWYKVVQIGNQCWMKENMRCTTKPDGTNILQATASGYSNSDPRAYRYNNSTDYSDKYGLLYNFPAAMNITDRATSFTYPHRGICPEGWHIPQDGEWSTLALAAGCTANYDSGTGLGKLTSGCDWNNSSSTTAPGNYSYSERDSSGFSALPAGYYNSSIFSYVGSNAVFWSATSNDDQYARNRSFAYDCEFVKSFNIYREIGTSVRCVRDVVIDTLTFMPNGATGGTMEKQVVVRGVATAIQTNGFTHDGNWEFAGWSTGDCDNTVAYADQANITTNGNVTLYAQWHTFCTGTHMSNEKGTARVDSVKDHQNNWYKVVQIGNQCWTKENMRCTTSPKGGLVSGVTSSYDSLLYYDYATATQFSLRERGYLYNWQGAMDNVVTLGTGSVDFPNHRGICPIGWHIPTDGEWKTLELNTGVCSSANVGNIGSRGSNAGRLTGGCDWSASSNAAAPGNYSYSERNSYGFSVLPVGLYSNGCSNAGSFAFFWSATSYVSNGAYYRTFSYAVDSVIRGADAYNNGGFSVRCIRDTIGKDTLTFMPNGATDGTMNQQVVDRGVVTAIQANGFTHEGNWEFLGWSTSNCDNTVAYADQANITTNGNVTLYAQWHTFCTGMPMDNEMGTARRVDSVSDHQGNWYKVVQFGTGSNKQCWLAENMRCTTSPKGNLPAEVNKSSNYEAYYYDYTEATQFSLRERGYLYNWAGAIDTNGTDDITASFTNRRGICPEGWHIPTDAEWTTMEQWVAPDATDISSARRAWDFQGSATDLAASLAGGCDWNGDGGTGKTPNSYSNPKRNSSGFSALPAGFCYIHVGFFRNWGVYQEAGDHANFWCATSSPGIPEHFACVRHLICDSAGMERQTYFKYYGLSVRCVRAAMVDTITFIPNGATGIMNKQLVDRGFSTAIQANGFTHEDNWEFLGWNDACDGSGNNYTDGANITTNGNVTLYAQWHTFCTGTPMGNEMGTARVDSVKDHQDNWYKVVQIGNQCWTKENMRCSTSPKGNLTSGGNQESEYKAYYYDYSNNNPLSLRERGYLYNWAGALDTNGTSEISASFTNRRGICPAGWHLPTDAEWQTLELSAGICTSSTAGNTGWRGSKSGSLTGGCDWPSDSIATAPGNYSYSERNNYGFSALPAGCYLSGFYFAGSSIGFWSSTSADSDLALYRNIYNNTAEVLRSNYDKKYGFSIRCLRDDAAPSFTCGTSTLTDIDGNTYNTVSIGSQCWMKENLKTTKYADGTSIERGNSGSDTVAYWYYPNNDTSNKATYGLLYNWPAVMGNSSSSSSNPSGVQGICPTGWHVPSDTEWTQLTDSVSGQSQYCCSSNTEYIAKALASTTGWNSYTGSSSDKACYPGYNPSGNNATGFSALPAGGIYYGYYYYGFGSNALFWSTTEYDSTIAYYRYLGSDSTLVYRDNNNKNVGYSIRCLRDN